VELGLTDGRGFFQTCVFASCSQIPSVRRRRTSAGLRTSSLARRPRPISPVPPRHGVKVVRPFRSKSSDHPAVRIPGVVLEAVTTSVIRPPAPCSPLFSSSCTLALTCFESLYPLFNAHRPYHMYRRIVQDVITCSRLEFHYYVFFSQGWNTVLYLL